MCQSDQCIQEFMFERKKCARVKNPEVLKSKLIRTVHQKGHMSEDQLVQEFDIREKQGVNREETPKVPKFRVNLDRSSKGTHVRISTCSGVRRSGELECASVESLEARSLEVEEQKWHGIMTSLVVMWTFPIHAMCHHLSC
jgi:hypothetical protein